MSDLVELEDHNHQKDKCQSMNWYNRDMAQTRITNSLSNDGRFSVLANSSFEAINQIDLSQFSLKAKDELKPDVCLYPKKAQTMEGESNDALREPKIPLLAIEINSPEQGVDDILAKFEIYFALGIKSCWLVIPSIEVVEVYSQLNQNKLFSMNDTKIIDEVMDIHLPIQRIFGW